MSKALYTTVYNAFFIALQRFIIWYKRVFLYLLIIVSMKYKGLSNRRFCPLKDNIVLQGFIFSSNGLLVCYSITILFVCKVLLDVMFKGFKGALVCRVVWCAGNNKVVRWCGGGGVIHKVIKGLWIVLLVWMVLWMGLWMIGKWENHRVGFTQLKTLILW